MHVFPLQFNPILYMWFRDSCFKCDDSLSIQVFPLLFNIGMVYGNLTILFQMCEGYVSIQRGGLPVVGGGRISDDS